MNMVSHACNPKCCGAIGRRILCLRPALEILGAPIAKPKQNKGAKGKAYMIQGSPSIP
jgi:hypothetical protein